MIKSIQFGSKRIEFTLEFVKRKSLGITVTPEMDVIVKAPLGSSLDRINELVRKRASWILKQQDFFMAFFPKLPPKKFISGETHLYMGRRYILKVLQKKRESVKLQGKYIYVTCQNKDKAKQLLKVWYLYHAENKFVKYVPACTEKFNKYGVKPESLVLREMHKRWGSCTPKGKIILNPELIKAPRGCIEYVIIHELCHLVYNNHTQKFINLQKKMMPNWEIWKARLESLLA